MAIGDTRGGGPKDPGSFGVDLDGKDNIVEDPNGGGPKDPDGWGIGPEGNADIAKSLKRRDYHLVMDIIKRVPDKEAVCRVVLGTSFDRNFVEDRTSFVDGLTKWCLNEKNIEAYKSSFVTFMKYIYTNSPGGERFFENPYKKGETLWMDSSGDIVSYQGEPVRVEVPKQDEPGKVRDEWSLPEGQSYEVLSGVDKGNVFSIEERPISLAA